jgi:hypothetical protein
LDLTLDRNGIHSTEKHIEAIKNVSVPTSLSELKNFLGMVAYNIKYIPNSAESLKPIYKLTRKEDNIIWSYKCNNAFNQIKKLLISNRILSNFDSKLPLKLAVDASVVCAILSHVYNDNTERSMVFALHLLTKAEKKVLS